MACELVISPKAYVDMERIRNWYDDQSIIASNWFLDEVNNYVYKITRHPGIYKVIAPNVRDVC